MISSTHRQGVQHLNTSPSDSYYYNHISEQQPPRYHPAPTQGYPASKRLKVYQSFDNIPSTFDCPSLVYPTMPQVVSRQRSHAPQINLHRASEPASPVTIASTVSNHSTPSPSPSRVTIVSDNNAGDFSLFEDGAYSMPEHQPKQHTYRLEPRYTNTSNPSPSQVTGSFSDMDATWPHYSSHMMGDVSKLQQHQPFNQHNTSTFGNGGFAHNSDDDDLPALSPSRSSAQHSSRPSISEIDMPATPVHSPIRRENNGCSQPQTIPTLARTVSDAVPKLTRTISDVVQDELYYPVIAPRPVHSQPDHAQATESNSKVPTLFKQAQSQHAKARSTPSRPMSTIRDHSPFRANSPFHPARTHQEVVSSPTRTTTTTFLGPFSARAQRENAAERDAEVLREQLKKEYEDLQDAPKTISPKDAYIEYNEPEGDGIQGSLFNSSQTDDSYSQHSSNGVDVKSENDSYHGSVQGDDDSNDTQQSYSSMATSRPDSDINMEYNNLPIFDANAQQYGQHLNIPIPDYTWGESSESSESTSRRSDDTYDLMPSPLIRPDDTRANDGAYSCTVPGCMQRFSTASKMSKHRREAHRHGTPLGGRDGPLKSLLQGPSRCARINPTTGKPCNTIFSRPYDLTRHEDTIHNTARQKVRCEICNDEKTFSRQDALTRHKKVKHGIDK